MTNNFTNYTWNNFQDPTQIPSSYQLNDLDMAPGYVILSGSTGFFLYDSGLGYLSKLSTNSSVLQSSVTNFNGISVLTSATEDFICDVLITVDDRLQLSTIY
jgi:hypothetical protein